MSAITTASSDSLTSLSLPDLSCRIWEEGDKAKTAAETALSHATKCGELLLEAKARIPHGSWTKWIEDNTQLTHRTANCYMELGANSQRVANLDSIRGALKMLADEKAEKRGRQFSETYIPFDGEAAAIPPAPAPRPSPAPVTLEAEIVEPGPTITPVSQDDEPAAVVVDGTREKLPKWIPDDAERLWLLARINLDKILPSDISRERVAREVIAYGEQMLATQKRP